MDLSDLRIFRAVVEAGGITAAARQLHRVQSNVTTRVRQLEENLGVELFIREGKKLHLSPAGQVLLDYADRLLTMAEEARNAVQDPSPRGLFRLGGMESTAAVRLPGPLSTYHQRYPDVELEFRDGNPLQLATWVLAGELDAAFVAEPVPDAPFEKAHAFEEELVIVASAKQPPVDVAGDTPQTIVAFEVGCPYRKRLETWYEGRGDMPVRTIEISSYHVMLGCVAAGMGMSMLPRSVLSAFPGQDRLSVHALPSGQERAEIALIWRKGANSPKIAALLEILRENRGDDQSGLAVTAA